MPCEALLRGRLLSFSCCRLEFEEGRLRLLSCCRFEDEEGGRLLRAFEELRVVPPRYSEDEKGLFAGLLEVLEGWFAMIVIVCLG